jgi:hypothetical protein
MNIEVSSNRLDLVATTLEFMEALCWVVTVNPPSG